MVKFG